MTSISGAASLARLIIRASSPFGFQVSLPVASLRWLTPNVITGGIGRYEKGNESLNKMGSIKATNVFGGHQLKYGLEYSNVAFETLGGYVLTQLDELPVPGDVVDAAGFRLTVLEVRDRRIRRLRGIPLPPAPDEEADG